MATTNNNGVITLNVGGITYTTRLTTLTKYADSQLAQMFGGGLVADSAMETWPAATHVQQDMHGNFVIDRDGDLFRYILNFLRTEVLNLPDGFQHTDALMTEVEFYDIKELKQALETKTILKVEERVYDQSGRKFDGSYSDWTILGDPPPLLWLAEVGVFCQEGMMGPSVKDGGRKLHRSWYNDVRIAVSQEGYQYGYCRPETPILKECIFNEIAALGYKLKCKLNYVAPTLEINQCVRAFVHLNQTKSQTYIFQLQSRAR